MNTSIFNAHLPKALSETPGPTRERLEQVNAQSFSSHMKDLC